MAEQLTSITAYPHEVEFVQVRETHSSTVFLTGQYAYKVKKPVSFEYLDYSTVDRRRFYCLEEVRLNRDLCDDVYLGVVPISLKNGRLVVDGDGEIVDWAVKMRQLNEKDLLSNRLEAGAIHRVDIERTAARVAAFHQNEFRDPLEGTAVDLAILVDDACTTMDQVAGDEANSRYLIRPFLAEFLADNKELLAERLRTGRVRDCHGDLRTQNICLDPTGVQIFDCVEFSTLLRFIDVAADVACLAMDIDLAGRADLRETLISAYVSRTGDSSLRSVLPFYQTYRAVVRGNLAMRAANERARSGQDRDEQLKTAAAAYDLARCYASKRDRPALFVTVGYCGAGKSTLAHEVSRRLGASHVSSDRIRRELVGLLPKGDDVYSDDHHAHIYDELRHRALDALDVGTSVILDATFLAQGEQAEAAGVASLENADFWILKCECPEETIRERLCDCEHHTGDLSDADIAVFERQISQFSGLTVAERHNGKQGGVIQLNTSLPVEITAREVVNRVLAR